jgi:S1-C subfamily serine protease
MLNVKGHTTSMRSDRNLRIGVAVVAAAAAVVLGTLAAARAHAATRGLAAGVDPAIVDIRTNLAYQGAAAAGTGIVIDSNGLVLTNNHVIRGATAIRVTDIGNGKTYKGTVIGYDVANDVALVQLTGASGLQTATIGGSAKVGDSVTAFGNAGGVGGTPSSASGTVTGVDRSITASDDGSNPERLTGLIETNANIQPGDSGGPLVDANGAVIGMDTAASLGYTFTGQSKTDAYAITISHALTIAKRIEARHATATTHIGPTAMLGVQLNFAGNGFGFGPGGDFGSNVNGAPVVGVVSGSPAAKAGLQQGDTITAINGRAIRTENTISNLILAKTPGQTVTLRWTDFYGTPHSGTLTLAAGPPQ